MKNNTQIYIIVFILLSVNLLYNKILNKDNRIEYYFHEKSHFKYKTIKYCLLFLNIVLMIYIKYIYKELIIVIKRWIKS